MHIINLLFIGGSLDRHINLKHSAVLLVGRRREAGWYGELAVLCSIGKSCPEKRGRLKKKRAERLLRTEYFWLWDTMNWKCRRISTSHVQRHL